MIKFFNAINYTVAVVGASLLSSPTLALEATNERPELAIGSMLGSLILVLVCIFVFAFLMKKTNAFRHSNIKNPIKVIATHPLTNKSRVQIIEVNNKQYLLGVSEQSVQLLDQLAEPITGVEKTSQQVTPSFATAFTTVLSRAGKKNNE